LAGDPERALGYYLAAIRETFEEVGILLAKARSGAAATPLDATALRAGREAVRGGKGAFWSWLRECGLRPAVEDLAYFAHWITPAGRPKRFDTRFFLAPVSPHVRPEPDQEEIVNCVWIAPAGAIAAERGQRMRMVNATVKNLELLAEFGSTSEALAGLGNRAVPTIMPKLVPQGDGYRIVHPWEPGYESV
jgi:8-oxo-dGTP pyrophosphatase MutT (NUDIX family)